MSKLAVSTTKETIASANRDACLRDDPQRLTSNAVRNPATAAPAAKSKSASRKSESIVPRIHSAPGMEAIPIAAPNATPNRADLKTDCAPARCRPRSADTEPEMRLLADRSGDCHEPAIGPFESDREHVEKNDQDRIFRSVKRHDIRYAIGYWAISTLGDSLVVI